MNMLITILAANNVTNTLISLRQEQRLYYCTNPGPESVFLDAEHLYILHISSPFCTPMPIPSPIDPCELQQLIGQRL